MFRFFDTFFAMLKMAIKQVFRNKNLFVSTIFVRNTREDFARCQIVKNN